MTAYTTISYAKVPSHISALILWTLFSYLALAIRLDEQVVVQLARLTLGEPGDLRMPGPALHCP